ncbi:hypothetical protein AB0L53_24515 [Nonomuraea sp. NPDC052129]
MRIPSLAASSLALVHPDEACGAFLPGCFFCPWTSRLVREVPAP